MAKISKVMVGESLVGDGNEVAHVDLLIGPRGSAVEAAFCNALTNNKDGFTSLLAVIAPNLQCKPNTVMFNKVTIKGAKQAVQMFGPAQHAVAKAVQDSVADGVIPANEADDVFICVGVFIHWDAADDAKIQQYNYEATKEAIKRAVEGTPTAAEATAQRNTGEASVRGLDKRQPRTGKTICRAGWPVAPVEKALGLLKHSLGGRFALRAFADVQNQVPSDASCSGVSVLSCSEVATSAAAMPSADSARISASLRTPPAAMTERVPAFALTSSSRAKSGPAAEPTLASVMTITRCGHSSGWARMDGGPRNPSAKKSSDRMRPGWSRNRRSNASSRCDSEPSTGRSERFGKRGGERFRVGDAGIHPEFRRSRHGSQPRQRRLVRRTAFDGVQIGDVEDRERIERAQTLGDGDGIGAFARAASRSAGSGRAAPAPRGPPRRLSSRERE